MQQLDTIDPDSIRAYLKRLAEPEFQRFSANLLPGVSDVLGVRKPFIDRLAKEIVARGEELRCLSVLTDADGPQSHEEILLLGRVIVSLDEERVFEWLPSYIPLIRNWATCDSFCAAVPWSQENEDRWCEIIDALLRGKEEGGVSRALYAEDDEARAYEVRIALVLMLFHAIQKERLSWIFEWIARVDTSHYYVHMAVAWLLSFVFKKYPQETEAYLCGAKLDDKTLRKSLQKIRELNSFPKNMTKDITARIKAHRAL